MLAIIFALHTCDQVGGRGTESESSPLTPTYYTTCRLLNFSVKLNLSSFTVLMQQRAKTVEKTFRYTYTKFTSFFYIHVLIIFWVSVHSGILGQGEFSKHYLLLNASSRHENKTDRKIKIIIIKYQSPVFTRHYQVYKCRMCLVTVRRVILGYVAVCHGITSCLCSGVGVWLRRRPAGELASLLGGKSLCWSLQEDWRPQRRLWNADHPPACQGRKDQSAPVTQPLTCRPADLQTDGLAYRPSDWPTCRLRGADKSTDPQICWPIDQLT